MNNKNISSSNSPPNPFIQNQTKQNKYLIILLIFTSSILLFAVVSLIYQNYQLNKLLITQNPKTLHEVKEEIIPTVINTTLETTSYPIPTPGIVNNYKTFYSEKYQFGFQYPVTFFLKENIPLPKSPNSWGFYYIYLTKNGSDMSPLCADIKDNLCITIQPDIKGENTYDRPVPWLYDWSYSVFNSLAKIQTGESIEHDYDLYLTKISDINLGNYKGVKFWNEPTKGIRKTPPGAPFKDLCISAINNKSSLYIMAQPGSLDLPFSEDNSKIFDELIKSISSSN